MSNPLDNRFSDLNKQGFMKQKAQKTLPIPIFRNGYLIEKTSGGYDLLSYHGACPISFHKTKRQAEAVADILPPNR